MTTELVVFLDFDRLMDFRMIPEATKIDPKAGKPRKSIKTIMLVNMGVPSGVCPVIM